MFRALSPTRLAAIGIHHPWRVVAVWAVLLVAGMAAASTIGSVLTTEFKTLREDESIKANNVIDDRFGAEYGSEFVIVESESAPVESAEFRAVAEQVVKDLRGLGEPIGSVVSYYETPDPSLVAADKRTLLIPVALTVEATKAGDEDFAPIEEILVAASGNGFRVITGGDISISAAFTETSEKDLQKAEIIGLPIALVILVVVFGALVAAGLPIGLALVSIVISVGAAALVGQAFELSFFVVNMITMIGLAVGIDYSLLIVQRFREERANGLSRDAAIAKASNTASRSVLFSGFAVMAALVGLFLVPDNIYRSLAIGAVIVVFVAVAAALTLLPAVLRLVGDKVNKGRIPLLGRGNGANNDGGIWARTTGFFIRHAVLSVIGSVVLLLAAAAPYLNIKLGNSGVSSLPPESEARQAFEVLDLKFNAGLLSPADVVIDAPSASPAVVAGIERLRVRLADDPAFGAITSRTDERGSVTVVSAPIKGDPQADEARAALRRLRNEHIPAAFGSLSEDVFVTGITATSLDNEALIVEYTSIVFTFVLGLSFIILMVVFRSIVVPIKAIIMNLLSVGAAYGLIVLVFAEGVGADLLGFQQADRVDAWIPLFLFTVLFGLSMDYHVFLISRIRERYLETGDNRGAVIFGVRSTAGMITGAALIMVAVFGGFALGDLVAMQQMGFGLAVAVFIDATIVRSILVPASMELLGSANWYLPSWLQWLPRLDVEGVADRHHEVPAPGGASAFGLD